MSKYNNKNIFSKGELVFVLDLKQQKDTNDWNIDEDMSNWSKKILTIKNIYSKDLYTVEENEYYWPSYWFKKTKRIVSLNSGDIIMQIKIGNNPFSRNKIGKVVNTDGYYCISGFFSTFSLDYLQENFILIEEHKS